MPPSKGATVREIKYKYPLNERIQWARLSVKAARIAGSEPSPDMVELAALALPWEDEAPAEYVS